MEDQIMKLMVAPATEVKRDVRKNLPWVAGLLGATIAYVLISSAVIRVFESHWTYLHACYFTVINMTTVGFGDVVPLTHGGKVIAGINALVGLLLFGILVAVLALALQPAGWSATLVPTGAPKVPEQGEPRNTSEQPRHSEETRMRHDTADFLEGLAKLVRAADSKQEISSREGRVRIDMFSDGPAPGFIRLRIHVAAG